MNPRVYRYDDVPPSLPPDCDLPPLPSNSVPAPYSINAVDFNRPLNSTSNGPARKMSYSSLQYQHSSKQDKPLPSPVPSLSSSSWSPKHRPTASGSSVGSMKLSQPPSVSGQTNLTGATNSPTTPASTSTQSRGNSSKSVLTVALQKAQSAVLLDSANNVPAAVAAYTQSVRLLEEVMARVEESAANWKAKEAAKHTLEPISGETEQQRKDRIRREEKAAKREKARIEEGRRLKNIHDTYLERIQMLSSSQDVIETSSINRRSYGSLPTTAYQAEVNPDKVTLPEPPSLPTKDSARASMSTITPQPNDRESVRASLNILARSSILAEEPYIAAHDIGSALINGLSSPISLDGDNKMAVQQQNTKDIPSSETSSSLPLPKLESRLDVSISRSPAFGAVPQLQSMPERKTKPAHPYAYAPSSASSSSSMEYLPLSSTAIDVDWLSMQDAKALGMEASSNDQRQSKPLPPISSRPASTQSLVLPNSLMSDSDATPKPEVFKSILPPIPNNRSSNMLFSTRLNVENPPLLNVPPPTSPLPSIPSSAASASSFESLYSTPIGEAANLLSATQGTSSASSSPQSRRRPSLAESLLPLVQKKSSTRLKSSMKLINPTTDKGTISQRRRSPIPDSTSTFGQEIDGLPTTSSQLLEAGDNISELESIPLRHRSISQPARRPSLPAIHTQPMPNSANQYLPKLSHSQQGSITFLRKSSAPALVDISPNRLDMISQNGYFDTGSFSNSRSTTPGGSELPPSPSLPSFSPGTSQSPHSAQLAATMPIVPRALFAPVSAYRRPFQLMIRLKLSIQQGAYVTPRLFVPKTIWQAPSTKLLGLETKIKCIDMLLEALEVVERSGEVLLVPRAVDQPTVSRATSVKLLKELETFEVIMMDVQNLLSKKLGFVEPVNGKKSSNAFGALLPKLSRSFDRMTKNKSADVQLIYCEALAKLFQEIQVIDRHLALSTGDIQPSPYADLSVDVRSSLEAYLRRISEFCKRVVIRFVLRDLGVLLDKHAKRAIGWIAE